MPVLGTGAGYTTVELEQPADDGEELKEQQPVRPSSAPAGKHLRLPPCPSLRYTDGGRSLPLPYVAGAGLLVDHVIGVFALQQARELTVQIGATARPHADALMASLV